MLFCSFTPYTSVEAGNMLTFRGESLRLLLASVERTVFQFSTALSCVAADLDVVSGHFTNSTGEVVTEDDGKKLAKLPF